ncbi:MAG: hypothetical protein UY24_C0022G0001 [Parcubacteria group bacterium GW2011_GWA1_48_11b]|nr:MAG: hypothetical protein UY24_C0022G0001 [Parcubacteria group bacterium GW2011_GWA1_48_11b]
MLNSNGMFGASVTQLAEYLPFKQEVAGSNPAGCTTESKLLCFRRDYAIIAPLVPTQICPSSCKSGTPFVSVAPRKRSLLIPELILNTFPPYPTPTRLYIGKRIAETRMATAKPRINTRIGSISWEMLSMALSDSDL